MNARAPSRWGGIAWPLVTLSTWVAAWAVFLVLGASQAPLPIALAAASAVPLIAAGCMSAPAWRRLVMALGFPLSLGALAAAGSWPTWTWLLAFALLASAYPLHAWRDAPLFPTPRDALRGVAQRVALPESACIVDAGCGVGDGLRELRREYPHARLVGWEWSWPLRWICAARTRFARVRRADMWRADWSGFDLVYLFQRPESMPRAVDKASHELRAGAWLASLEFEAPSLVPQHVLQCDDGRRVWLYQAPFRQRGGRIR